MNGFEDELRKRILGVIPHIVLERKGGFINSKDTIEKIASDSRVSSVSTFDSFQAERLKLRYRNSKGKKELLHTLNGSSLALPRIIAGILENFQDANGINLPKVLVPYTGFEKI